MKNNHTILPEKIFVYCDLCLEVEAIYWEWGLSSNKVIYSVKVNGTSTGCACVNLYPRNVHVVFFLVILDSNLKQ